MIELNCSISFNGLFCGNISAGGQIYANAAYLSLIPSETSNYKSISVVFLYGASTIPEVSASDSSITAYFPYELLDAQLRIAKSGGAYVSYDNRGFNLYSPNL